ncbi:MAG: toprim domain-containing protein [Patescibacteria group bacterium]
MPSPRIQKLVIMLTKMPGLGPRQAARLIYHILDQNREFALSLAESIRGLVQVKRCALCFQAHEETGQNCTLCVSALRENKILMVVEKDTDLDTLEKTGVYNGKYFVLGGVISPLQQDGQKRLRLSELVKRISVEKNIEELVLGTSSTAEGDLTARYIEKILEPHIAKNGIKISRLGRGLSTGLELEFSDPDTFKNAYLNRK